MTEFDTLLKRSFAEAHEPADDGFSVNVGRAVARHESAAKIRNAAQTGALAVAGAAVLYGFYGMAMTFAPDVLASVGFGVLRAQSAINGPGADMVRTLSVALPQILLGTGAIVGGLVAYRASQE
jgi:hypothetical protein